MWKALNHSILINESKVMRFAHYLFNVQPSGLSVFFIVSWFSFNAVDLPFFQKERKSYEFFIVCGQLWIFYSKINFKVLYLTQFSVVFEKNKITGCR